MADGSLTFDTKVDTGGFGSGMDKIKGLANTALGVFTGNMMTKAVDGIKNLGKSALDSVSSLEQNVGGVETLFKDSADIVIKNANNAYKTAGLSANSYMETVTSFSASLLQSVGGDTKKAAKAADVAITDMSDNANKMGTDMGAIQNAYQGFAKQNYTMLDNLKLGYGGTKSEMERLLADAQKITGVKYDINNLNDVYSAIHVIQGELGITGTTAKEASTTIEGSMNAAKAAWDNFMNGSGDAQELADAFGTAAQNIVKNLSDIIPRLAGTIPQLIGAIVPQIPGFVSAMVPAVVGAAWDLLSSVANAVTSFNYAGVASKIADAISGFIQSGTVGKFMSAAAAIIKGLADGIGKALPIIVPAIVNLIAYLVQGIIDHIPDIINAGKELLSGLADALSDTSPVLQPVADIIKGIADNMDTLIPIVTGLTAAFVAYKAAMAIADTIQKVNAAMTAFKTAQEASTIAQAALNAVMNLNPFVLIATLIAGVVVALITLWNTNEGFRKAVTSAWEAVKSVISTVVDAIVGFFTETIPAAFQAFIGFFQQLPATVSSIVQSIVQWFQQLPEAIATVFTNIFTAIGNWGASVLSWIAATVPTMINNIITFFQELPGRLAYALGYAIGTIIKWGAQVISWIATNVPIWIDNIVTFFSQLPGRIWTWLVNTVTKLIQWGQNMVANASTAMSNMLTTIVTWISQLPGRVWTWLVNTVTKVIQWGQNMVQNASSAMSNFIAKVVEWMQQLPGKMWSFLTQAIAKVQQFASDLAQKGTSAAKGFFDNIVSGLSSLPGKMADIGSNIVSGIWNGISGGWSWLKDKVAGLANDLLQGAKDALGIGSPSRKFRDEVGKWILPGMEVGMEKTMPGALKSMRTNVGALVSEAQDAVSGISANMSLNASGAAGIRAAMGAGTTVYYDQRVDQTNTYQVPVASPSEVARTQREAVRKLVGGVA